MWLGSELVRGARHPRGAVEEAVSPEGAGPAPLCAGGRVCQVTEHMLTLLQGKRPPVWRTGKQAHICGLASA